MPVFFKLWYTDHFHKLKHGQKKRKVTKTLSFLMTMVQSLFQTYHTNVKCGSCGKFANLTVFCKHYISCLISVKKCQIWLLNIVSSIAGWLEKFTFQKFSGSLKKFPVALRCNGKKERPAPNSEFVFGRRPHTVPTRILPRKCYGRGCRNQPSIKF